MSAAGRWLSYGTRTYVSAALATPKYKPSDLTERSKRPVPASRLLRYTSRDPAYVIVKQQIQILDFDTHLRAGDEVHGMVILGPLGIEALDGMRL